MSNKEINAQSINNEIVIIQNHIVSKIKNLLNDNEIEQNFKNLYIEYNQYIDYNNYRMNYLKQEILEKLLEQIDNIEQRSSTNEILEQIDNIEQRYNTKINEHLSKIDEYNQMIKKIKVLMKEFNLDESIFEEIKDEELLMFK